jgi:hypothetical protein
MTPFPTCTRKLITASIGVLVFSLLVWSSASAGPPQVTAKQLDVENGTKRPWCAGWSAKKNTMLCVLVDDGLAPEYTAAFLNLTTGRIKKVDLVTLPKDKRDASGVPELKKNNLKAVNRRLIKDAYTATRTRWSTYNPNRRATLPSGLTVGRVGNSITVQMGTYVVTRHEWIKDEVLRRTDVFVYEASDRALVVTKMRHGIGTGVKESSAHPLATPKLHILPTKNQSDFVNDCAKSGQGSHIAKRLCSCVLVAIQQKYSHSQYVQIEKDLQNRKARPDFMTFTKNSFEQCRKRVQK